MSIIEVNGISKYFGGLRALYNISFTLEKGEILGLIGPNGAGKTTLFNIIAGTYPPSSGSVQFKGEEITSQGPRQICHKGISRTYQLVRTFSNLTVYENVLVGLYFGKPESEEGMTEREAYELLRLTGLLQKANTLARSLTLVGRKQLEIARALATRPKVLLLDEAISGLNPTETENDDGIDPKHSGPRDYRVHDRAYHEGGHGPFRPYSRTQFWGVDCPGDPRTGLEEQRCDRSLFRSRRGTGGIEMLKVEEISAYYGDIQVLWEASLAISAKEMVTMVGSNGSGKTTTINTVVGMLHPTSGSIHFLGQPIHQLPTHRIVERGISLIPEGRKLFPEMTVLENLELGAYFPNARKKIPETLQWVFGLFPRLEERKFQLAGTLSGGEQQMCTVGRGLMSIPQLLLIDEPSMGLAPLLVAELFRTIRKINREGVTVFLVEQNARLAMEISDRTYVLENGRVVREGKSKELLEDDDIRKAYLGL